MGEAAGAADQELRLRVESAGVIQRFLCGKRRDYDKKAVGFSIFRGESQLPFLKAFYYVGNIAGDISGITRKSTAENPIGVADFLILYFVSVLQFLLSRGDLPRRSAFSSHRGEKG